MTEMINIFIYATDVLIPAGLEYIFTSVSLFVKKTDIKWGVIYIYIYIYTGCNRRNVPDFGRVFLMLNYTDITQNTYIQSWAVTEIMVIEMCGLLDALLASYNAAPHNRYQPHPTEPKHYTKCSDRVFVLLKMGIMMPETCWDRSW